MKYAFFIIVLVIVACKGEQDQKLESTQTSQKPEAIVPQQQALPFEVYDYDGLVPLITKKDDKVHVVNFWATWCAPCIKELPYFEQIREDYKGDGLELLLVSLDFPRQYKSKLVPFLEQRKIGSEVVALDDVDQNRWIPAIDSTWSGAIPATIIYKGNQRKFYEQSFSYEELKTEIEQFLN